MDGPFSGIGTELGYAEENPLPMGVQPAAPALFRRCRNRGRDAEVGVGEQAESGDPTVNRLPDGETALAQAAVVASRRDGQIGASRGQYLELHEVIAHARESRLVTNALQDFAQNQIC
jgi:hypothetical protein